jgi:hypothetical protein
MTGSTKRYLFFLRHYNDIDNIAPAIYFFLDSDIDNIADVVLYDEGYDHRNNENLDFLSSIFPKRFNYYWIGDLFGVPLALIYPKKVPLVESNRSRGIVLNVAKAILPPILVKGARVSFHLICRIKSKLFNRFGSNAPNDSNPQPRLLITRIRMGLIDSEVIKKGLKNLFESPIRPSLVIFDINRTNCVAGLLASLRALGAERIVSLPVSPLINYNVLREYPFFDTSSDFFSVSHDYSGFDSIAFVDGYFCQSYNSFLPRIGIVSSLLNKTRFLGSIRYCREWLSIRNQYPCNDDESALPAIENPKILFLFSRAVSNVNSQEVDIALKMLSSYESFTIAVKGHTRAMAASDYFNTIGSSQLLQSDALSTSSLINWADVIVYWSTSVAIEGFVKNKYLICLDYVTSNLSLYALYNAGCVARCRDDFAYALYYYNQYRSLPAYNQDGVDRFLSEIVHAGDKSVSTPVKYLEFMKANEFSS